MNYGGSTGYGRLYRDRLRRQWGVVDVEDVVAAALALAEEGQADIGRMAIRGGSAGGWTALAAVTTGTSLRTVFSAATSYFGVADLRDLASQAHDFESRYLHGLIGPLPGFDTVYVERSPVGHVTDATCPVLLLHGLDDPIVPPRQAESMAADLSAHGIRHALLTFKGESHGFRKDRDGHRLPRGGTGVLRRGARLRHPRHPAAAPHRAPAAGPERPWRPSRGTCRGTWPGGRAEREEGRDGRGHRKRRASASPPGRARPVTRGELRSARFPDDRDPDLAGVGQLLLHLLGHVPGDHLGLDVVHPLGLDHDPDLPAGLHGEHLLDAFLRGAICSSRSSRLT